MRRELKLPDIGMETDCKITISFWHIEDDEEFEKGDYILEVSTNNAHLNIAAPDTGKLIEILVQEGDTVTVGDVIAIIKTDD